MTVEKGDTHDIERIFEVPEHVIEEAFAHTRRRLAKISDIRRQARIKDAELDQLFAKHGVEAASQKRLKLLNERWPDPITPETILGRPLHMPKEFPSHAVSPSLYQITTFIDTPPYYSGVQHANPDTPSGVLCHAGITTGGFTVYAASGTHACIGVDAYAGVGNYWRASTSCWLMYNVVFDLTTNWSTICQLDSAHSEGWIGLLVFAYDTNWSFQEYPVWTQEWLWDDNSFWSGAGGSHYTRTNKVITSGAFKGMPGWRYGFYGWGGIEISAAGTGGMTWSKSSAIIQASIPSMRIAKMTL